MAESTSSLTSSESISSESSASSSSLEMNTKYTLCYSENTGIEALHLENFASENVKEALVGKDGTKYETIEDLDANEMPREIFMKKPNVVAAFSGTKKKNGKDTGERCVIVGVKKKLKPEQLAESDKIPSVLPDGVKTDVIEFSPIVSLSQCLEGTGEGCGQHATKHRPLIGGISSMVSTGTACTLGLIVKDKTDNKLVALTNNHCVGLLYDPIFKIPTYGSLSVLGNTMLQPSPYDGGTGVDSYGEVKRAVALQFGTDSTQNNSVDCAISSIEIDQSLTEILDINPGPFPFAAKAEYSTGINIAKSGRTTGNTPPPTITVISKNASINVSYGSEGDKDIAHFTNQLLYQADSRFTQGGDSGSAIIAVIDSQYKIIGLHYAGNAAGTIGAACHIEDVVDELEIEEWNGDIVVEHNNSPVISVNGICYSRVGPTDDEITHTVDYVYSSCEECLGAQESSSSESSMSSSSSSTSVEENVSSSSSSETISTVSSSSSTSSLSSSSLSSSSSSSSTIRFSTSSRSSISLSSSSSEFEKSFIKSYPRRVTLDVNTNNSVTIVWHSLLGASGYVIERKEGFNEWETLNEVEETSYIDSTLAPGKYYRYRIRGFYNV